MASNLLHALQDLSRAMAKPDSDDLTEKSEYIQQQLHIFRLITLGIDTISSINQPVDNIDPINDNINSNYCINLELNQELNQELNKFKDIINDDELINPEIINPEIINNNTDTNLFEGIWSDKKDTFEGVLKGELEPGPE